MSDDKHQKRMANKKAVMNKKMAKALEARYAFRLGVKAHAGIEY